MSIELLDPQYDLVCLGEAMELPSLANYICCHKNPRDDYTWSPLRQSRSVQHHTFCDTFDDAAIWVLRLLADVE